MMKANLITRDSDDPYKMTLRQLWSEVKRLKIDAPPKSRKADLLKLVIEERERLGITHEVIPEKRPSKRKATDDISCVDNIPVSEQNVNVDDSIGNAYHLSIPQRMHAMESSLSKILSRLDDMSASNSYATQGERNADVAIAGTSQQPPPTLPHGQADSNDGLAHTATSWTRLGDMPVTTTQRNGLSHAQMEQAPPLLQRNGTGPMPDAPLHYGSSNQLARGMPHGSNSGFDPKTHDLPRGGLNLNTGQPLLYDHHSTALGHMDSIYGSWGNGTDFLLPSTTANNRRLNQAKEILKNPSKGIESHSITKCTIVSPQLRNDTILGKDVNLAKFLISDSNESSHQKVIFTGGEAVSVE